MDMPREINPDKEINYSRDFLKYERTKYIRADLVEKVDDEAVREAVEKVKFYLSNGQAVLSDNVLKTLIRAATANLGCEGLAEALEEIEKYAEKMHHVTRVVNFRDIASIAKKALSEAATSKCDCDELVNAYEKLMYDFGCYMYGDPASRATREQVEEHIKHVYGQAISAHKQKGKE